MAPPTADTAAFCQVSPDFVIGRSGMRVRFDVLARDAEGEPLVPASGITWVAAAETVTGGGTGTRATFTLAAPGEAAEAVEARVGNTVCRARVTVLRAGVPPGTVRVLVTDERTGRPVPGAAVAVSNTQGEMTASSETDGHGVAWVPATGEVGLSVFHEEYGYLTLAHYDTGNGIRDVVLPLRRNPLDLYGGSRGTFFNVPTSKDILLGLSGLSPPAMGFTLHERQILGPSDPRGVDALGQPQNLRLPTGAFVSLARTVLRPEYASPGVAGVCDAELAGIPAPEDAIRTGTCGTRTSWALTGELPLTVLKSTGFDARLSFPLVLLQNTHMLRRFHSSVVRDVQFRLIPEPEDSIGSRHYKEVAHYTQVNHDFQQLPLGLQFSVLVPTPPASSKARLDRVVALGVADVAGRGMTPLGIGSTALLDDSAPISPIRMHMAPTHHGLEGSPYRLMVSASSTADQDPINENSVNSIMLIPLPGLPTDFRTVPPMRLSERFLPIPEHGHFNFNSFPYEGLQGREFRFITGPEPGDATLVSVTFMSNGDRPWMVLMDPQHAMTGVRLPLPPSRFHDRTQMSITGATQASTRSRLVVQVISTRKTDGSTLDLRTLAEAEEEGLTRLSDFVTAISEHDHGYPKVRWLVPKEGTTIPSIDHNTNLIVRISDFRVTRDPADNGHVRLSFQGGIGCENQPIRQTVNEEEFDGILYFNIPPDCRGYQVRMTAALVDANNVPLSPPVSDTIIVNII